MADRIEALRRVANWLDGDVEALAAAALRRMQEREPGIVAAVAGQRSQVIADAEEAISALADSMRRDIAAGDAGPGGAVRLALSAAAAGVPWETFAAAWSGYRAAVADAVAARLSDGSEGEAEAPEAQVAVMRFLLSYEDAMGGAIAAAFHTARPAPPEPRHELGARIEDLLAGHEVEEDELPFDLGGNHLAVIAWGEGDREAVEELRLLIGLPATIDARRDTVWAWFHGTADELAAAIERARDFRPAGQAQIALGEAQDGPEGFATSHFQACGAERVGMLSAAPLTAFVDVGLEAFALDDERLARAFVERELGPLAEDDPRAATLRETLSAYFAAGNSASAAAVALQLHERTVSYRIRAAEQRLGRYILDCQDSLALALRLRELFADSSHAER